MTAPNAPGFDRDQTVINLQPFVAPTQPCKNFAIFDIALRSSEGVQLL
jgi:hypothetical protein